MLRSTYRAAQQPAESPLPVGWTEHKAPTGHTYYYNADTKQSTYTRPEAPSDEPLQIDYGATQPDLVVRASINALDQFHQTNGRNDPRSQNHFTGGRSYQDRPQEPRRHGHQGDRPKSKAAIPNCAPWILVKTKLGRRFVHNAETKQSLWKFPSEVMMAVIDMDRMEWEAKKKAESQKEQVDTEKEADLADAGTQADKEQGQAPAEYDSDSYEEVEVTDEEGEEHDDPAAKRPRVSQDQPNSDAAPPGPLEFNEDDIAWQLAQMDQDERDTDENDYNEDDVQNLDDEADDPVDEEEEGLPLTDNDSIALFRSLLDDSRISPFSTFDKLIEDLSVVEDPRYIALPTTSRRREEFTSWSRDRIAEQKALQEQSSAGVGQSATSSKQKPSARSEYLSFLHEHATPKLYWPEFKRKYRKHDSMSLTDKSLQEKDKEKLYREYISKITKVSEQERRKTFLNLLKELAKEGKLDDVRGEIKEDRGASDLNWPNEVTGDIRWILVAKEKRQDLVLEFFRTF